MRPRLLATTFLLIAALAAPALAGPVAEVANLGDTLVFRPVVEFDQLILTVTGPCNFEVREVVTQGDATFRLTPEAIDGVYRAELEVIPHIDAEIVAVLKKARAAGDNGPVDQLCRDGKLPGTPLTQLNGFQIVRGTIVYDERAIEDPGKRGTASLDQLLGDGASASTARAGLKDQVINDDLIVDGSACVGFDCANGESFGFDTIRVKENNLRIKFDDTSTIAGFPNRDWQLTANDSASGGQNKFSIDDITGARTPFTIEAGAPSHSLYVDDGGRVGHRTSTPSTEIHVKDGDTPTLRLEQDGSSGFAPQTWDIAGNETNFFVRDVTSGSTLPLRLRPGASSNALFIDADSDVGFGTASPDAEVEVVASVVSPSQPMLLLNNDLGPPRLEQRNGAGNHTWRQTVTGTGEFNIDDTLDGVIELSLAQNGNLTITGNVITSNCPAGCGPDFVFEPDYPLMGLDQLGAFIAENRHLPEVPSAKEMESEGINMTQLQLKMLQKIEELTLYTLRQHDTIASLEARLAQLEATRTTE